MAATLDSNIMYAESASQGVNVALLVEASVSVAHLKIESYFALGFPEKTLNY